MKAILRHNSVDQVYTLEVLDDRGPTWPKQEGAQIWGVSWLDAIDVAHLPPYLRSLADMIDKGNGK
jgi:hypothetical protein